MNGLAPSGIIHLVSHFFCHMGILFLCFIFSLFLPSPSLALSGQSLLAGSIVEEEKNRRRKKRYHGGNMGGYHARGQICRLCKDQILCILYDTWVRYFSAAVVDQ